MGRDTQTLLQRAILNLTANELRERGYSDADANAGKIPKVAMLRAGFKVTPRAAGAVSVIVEWAIANHELALGRWPSQPEFSEYWKQPLRTTERDIGRFKQAFPEEKSPERLARWMQEQLGRRLVDEPEAAPALEYPPALVAA